MQSIYHLNSEKSCVALNVTDLILRWVFKIWFSHDCRLRSTFTCVTLAIYAWKFMHHLIAVDFYFYPLSEIVYHCSSCRHLQVVEFKKRVLFRMTGVCLVPDRCVKAHLSGKFYRGKNGHLSKWMVDAIYLKKCQIIKMKVTDYR